MSKAQGKSREEVINSLAERIDKFEKYSTPHSQAMADLASLLAKRLGLSSPEVVAVTEAARLHDIGLYAMSPMYHSTPNALRFEDRLDLWRHSIIGEQEMSKREFSRHAQLLVRWHHEWWNGTGYPDMLAFEDIPIGARILRAVELHNALTSARPYRAALGDKEALDALKASAGVECDPYVVVALIALLEEMYPPVEQTAPATIDEEATPSPFTQTSIEAEFADPESPIDLPDETTGGRQSASSIDNPSQGVTSTSWVPQRQVEQEPILNPINSSEQRSVTADESPRVWSHTPGSSEQSGSATGEMSQTVLESNQPVASPFSTPSINQQADTETEKPTELSTRQSQASSSGEAPQPPAQLEPLLKRRTFPQSLTTTPLEPTRQKVAVDESPRWRGWTGSGYNRKALLAFEASVLRQIPFETIAIAYSGEAKLDWYLKVWGKRILTNDERGWAAAIARAVVESREALGEERINQLLRDVYVPGNRLSNASLRRWFAETDCWWMENLRRNIAELEDESLRAQALLLGIQTGDYALSFNDETIDLRRPLATVFWRLAGRFSLGNIAHPHNRVSNLAPQDFIQQARADLLYLNLPPSQEEATGAAARAAWRESWVTGNAPEKTAETSLPPQTRQGYLSRLDRLLRAAAHIRKWAIGCQEVGLASAREVSELVKEHRAVRATYSKDVTEVAGGLRSYIIVAEK